MNATSASGATVDLWQRPERVVITATKSGGERTATRFAQYWVQAVTGEAADVNKDEVVTAAEAFDYANRQVAASYKSEVALATEHARIAGEETATFAVARIGGSALSGADPEVTALLAQRGEIEHDLDGVKERKAALSQDQYYDELEGVLVKLALLQKQIDAKRAVRMMQRRAQSLVIVFAALAAGSSLAQSIDYDPRRAPELRACDDHQNHGRIDQARSCYTQLLNSPNPIMQAEAAWALGDLQRANEIFRDFTRANARAVQPRIRWARLFLQTHQYNDAAEMFREALKIYPNDPHAKIGLARVLAERFEGEAGPLLEEVLREDDTLVEAQLLSAQLALEAGQVEAAQKALERAGDLAAKQKLPPLEVFAMRAALESSRDRDPMPWIKRALDYNPRYGAVYEQLAHFEIMRRRYREATTVLRRAVEVQPNLWSAHAELGSNLLRLGEVEEARQQLQAAYSGDPYSPTTVNSLRLLDRIDQFDVSSTPVAVAGDTYVVRLRLHRSESSVLEPYAIELVQQGIAAFSRRYGFKLQEPVTVELYPDHDDFAVRVAALPGIGLLGVTFGYVVAMDSPSGRASGDFHWGSTLWHELAHVFTLEATDHRVPRWLSEGISVFEEWRTGPTPGVVVPPEVITALSEDKFLPVSELDGGFIRPALPEPDTGFVHAGRAHLPVHRAALGLRAPRRAAAPVRPQHHHGGRDPGHVQDGAGGLRQGVRCVRALALRRIAGRHGRLSVAVSGSAQGDSERAME